jgi:hypothetical protein
VTAHRSQLDLWAVFFWRNIAIVCPKPAPLLAHFKEPIFNMDRLSILFALLIVLVVALDIGLNQGMASLFLARKFMDLIALVAFWR